MTIYADGYCCYFQVKNTLGFISKYECLNKMLKEPLKKLVKTREEMDDVEGKLMFPEGFLSSWFRRA